MTDLLTAPEGEVKARLAEEAVRVEQELERCLERFDMPEGLRASMRYSLMAGGKRIRPVLFLNSARMFGLSDAQVMPFAAGLECIHTYSLIHDDLPAMDDDDLRRGKPSNHRQFDEATAILAGDALLTDAFALMTQVEGVAAERVLAGVRAVALAAGSPGMVGGQFFDMQYTARQGITLEALAGMHAMKTGALIQVACAAGALLGGAGEKELDAMRAYGAALGAAFQITDDILDTVGDEKTLGKPVGSDAAKEKITYVSLMGLGKSRSLAEEKARLAVEALAGLEGDAARLLRGLAVYMVNRIE